MTGNPDCIIGDSVHYEYFFTSTRQIHNESSIIKHFLDWANRVGTHSRYYDQKVTIEFTDDYINFKVFPLGDEYVRIPATKSNIEWVMEICNDR